MKNARFKIAALVGGSVLLTLLIILVLFQVISSKRTEELAKEAIQAYSEVTLGETSAMQYTPTLIEMPNGLQGNPMPDHYYSTQDQMVVEWCRENDPQDIEKLTLDSHTLYVGIGSKKPDGLLSSLYALAGEEAKELEELLDLLDLLQYFKSSDPVPTIVYVDVTAELSSTRNMSFFFLAAAVVIGVLGSIEGYLIGRRLELSSKAEKQFFENTSHELKTPLTAIRGYAEGIEKGVINDNVKTGKVIAQEAEKMSHLIEEILLSARLESGAMPLHRETIQLNQLVEECLMPMEGAILSRGLQVELNLLPATVSADPDRLEHAISNLLTNAVKYAKTKLSLAMNERVLIIQNDCDPLSDEELTHIFDRFYTGRNGNTGIGLSLSKEIINLHGWKLRAERTGDGISFLINIR
ncbi:MAG: HAMP domain-containing histidine kinase [Eubacterium sp.]|nr:HAMP domain-containing histidine kinase [Eubacterium sp.]